MADVKRIFFDGPFGQVHVRVRKPAKPSSHLPLICLHQSPKSGREFLKVMYLIDDREVIAIDNPGHGESDVPASIDAATIENYAKSAWSIIDQMGLEKVDLLGHHTGSKVAAEMAYQAPDKVRQIVMVSALVLTPEEIAFFASQFQPIALDETGERFKTLWKKNIDHRGPGVSLEDLATSFSESLRAGEAYEWGHKAAFEYVEHFPERVGTLDHKITILNPNDMLYELTPRVLPLLKNGELINQPSWGFGFMDAFPDDAVKAFTTALS